MTESQVELAVTAANDGGHFNARFQVADVLNLPFPDNHFDAVYCNSFLMHVPDIMAVLAEIKPVLKEGGVLGARELIV
jgi:ubiquinone/menaquinone biosynthesis C-methylase UbiE